MKNKTVIFGILTGIIAPILCCMLILYVRFPQYMSMDYIFSLWTGGNKTALPIIKASMLINLPIFFISMQALNKDSFARGTLIGTFIIGAYVLFLHFFI